MTEEKPKELTRSEKFVNYTKGMGNLLPILLALVALGGSAIANLKGEPKADKANEKVEKAYEALASEVNKMKTELDHLGSNQKKLWLRFVNFQGREEGFTAGKLHTKLEECRASKPKPKMASKDTATLQKAMLAEQIKKRKLEEKRVKLLKSLTEQRPLPSRPMPKKLSDIKRRAD